MADELDDIKGREEFEAKADKVLYPDTHRKDACLLGKTISLRPLPIKYAKQINFLLEQMTAEAPDAKDGGAREDDLLIAKLCRAASIIATYHGEEFTPGQIEDGAGCSEIMAFCEAQVALNGENDFLLWRLRGVFQLLQRALVEKDRLIADATDLFQPLLSSEVSQKPGEGLSESSPITPTGN